MLNVMIVDDDYLVRQGFIRIMPWQMFDLQVVCEASNGVEALQLLDEYDVNLLITDLAMPGMSGIELMTAVRERYPYIDMVVLTFHHDFELIRDALRLGALDYITKIELEDDQMASILQRIVHRIHKKRTPAIDELEESEGLFDSDAVFCSIDNNLHENKWTILEQGDWEKESDLPHKFPYIEGHRSEQLHVKWVGVKGMKKGEFMQRLYLHGELELFYRLEDGICHYELPVHSLTNASALPKKSIIQLGMSWSSLAWMTDKALYSQLLEQTATARLPIAQLEQMIYMAIEEWGKFLDSSLFRFEEKNHPQTWQGWLNWLDEVREGAKRDNNEQVYSDEVITNIMRAVDYINTNLRDDIQLPEVASKVHMSRSYFSRCFRDVVGRTFQEYVRDQRIQHAKTLLSQTNKLIGWIASESGYPNERYFSKVFREATGMLPRDYRKVKLEVSNDLK